ncbi:late competence development ComFB family protein [Metabacillus sp. GX 13764]|uniref:late competence development ComFB family protein n=1 Tax=Metabacillus kandeliae TaxID=2900151 RepID=UPI001E426FB3|nr:late competence development ComFB family protein [Metabacillus kandeliae]MCD7034454.1 late competence development ComFB family protein [Metabacillus kandeliae]
MVVNVMEQIMADLLDTHLKSLQMNCTCEKCQSDVLALALNRTTPRYVTERAGTTYVKAAFIDKQEATSLIIILAECAKLVSDNPLCEKSRQNEMPFM